MVVKDGQMWRRVSSRKVLGQWYGFRDSKDEELDNAPDIFITIDGKVPKNMTGEGEDVFQLWPIKHNDIFRNYHTDYGYHYTVREYTYWDGVLHTRTQGYYHNVQIKWLEKQIKLMRENLKAHLNGEEIDEPYVGRPFFIPKDERFVQARY